MNVLTHISVDTNGRFVVRKSMTVAVNWLKAKYNEFIVQYVLRIATDGNWLKAKYNEFMVQYILRTATDGNWLKAKYNEFIVQYVLRMATDGNWLKAKYNIAQGNALGIKDRNEWRAVSPI